MGTEQTIAGPDTAARSGVAVVVVVEIVVEAAEGLDCASDFAGVGAERGMLAVLGSGTLALWMLALHEDFVVLVPGVIACSANMVPCPVQHVAAYIHRSHPERTSAESLLG